MTLPPVLSSLVGWLRAGYPQGVPERDYIPLLALLARRLTSEEVAAVAHELTRQGDSIDSSDIDNIDIGTLITRVTNELPRNEDVDRVRKQLATAGPFI